MPDKQMTEQWTAITEQWRAMTEQWTAMKKTSNPKQADKCLSLHNY